MPLPVLDTRRNITRGSPANSRTFCNKLRLFSFSITDSDIAYLSWPKIISRLNNLQIFEISGFSLASGLLRQSWLISS